MPCTQTRTPYALRRVIGISFQNNKTGLTYQEYLCVFLPFATASTINTAIVFTLPDMSYRKYLLSAVRPLPKNLQDKALEDFNAILWNIADMYLELADRISRQTGIDQGLYFYARSAVLYLWGENHTPG